MRLLSMLQPGAKRSCGERGRMGLTPMVVASPTSHDQAVLAPCLPGAGTTAHWHHCGWACGQEDLPVQDPMHWEPTLLEKGFTLSPSPGCDPPGQGCCQCLPTPPRTLPQGLGMSTHVTQLLLGPALRCWAPGGWRRDVDVSAPMGMGCWGGGPHLHWPQQ